MNNKNNKTLKRKQSRHKINRKITFKNKQNIIHKGGNPFVNIGSDISNILNYYKVSAENREYMINGLKDCIGLFSSITWKNANTWTSSNLLNNDISNTKNIVESTNNTINKPRETKKYKLKPSNSERTDFIQDSKVTSTTATFTTIGVFIIKEKSKSLTVEKKERDIEKDIRYKIIIYQNDTTKDYIIIFNYGFVLNFYEKSYIIKKIIKFIKLKITDFSKKIMLFGFSMGANMAQHVALQLLKNHIIINTNLFLISLGFGNAISEEDFTLLSTELNGHYISFANTVNILNDKITMDELLRKENEEYELNIEPTAIDYFILPSIQESLKNFKTLDTILLQTTLREIPKKQKKVKKPITTDTETSQTVDELDELEKMLTVYEDTNPAGEPKLIGTFSLNDLKEHIGDENYNKLNTNVNLCMSMHDFSYMRTALLSLLSQKSQ